MASIFSKIVAGEISAIKILESDHFLAFMDVFPLVEGHVLVIPKREEDFIFNLEDDELQALFLFAKPVANAMKNALDCKRIAVSVIGLEVPHAHVHLLPINSVEDTNFTKPKLQISTEKLQEIANRIIANL